jgi:hypothetical protein
VQRRFRLLKLHWPKPQVFSVERAGLASAASTAASPPARSMRSRASR